MSFETMLYFSRQKKIKLKIWEKKLHDSIFKELLNIFVEFL